ncbi:hypothetical protein ACWC9R_10600 [Streptomyces sp. NPDC001219]
MAGRRGLGGALLLCVPLLDIILLAATVISVREGAGPSIWHGLSAAYLGLTVVYGHRTLRWADAKFAHRYGGVAKPERPKLYGRQAIANAWRSWFTFLFAYVLSAALLIGLVVLAGGLSKGAPMLVWLNPLTKILLYSLIWPIVTTMWPGKAPEPEQEPEPWSTGQVSGPEPGPR